MPAADALVLDAARLGDDAAIGAILAEVCRITDMGFAAVARVTEERWIAWQVLDRIEFGLKPGEELELKTTICTDIRQCGLAVVIDHASPTSNGACTRRRGCTAFRAMPRS